MAATLRGSSGQRSAKLPNVKNVACTWWRSSNSSNRSICRKTWFSGAGVSPVSRREASRSQSSRSMVSRFFTSRSCILRTAKLRIEFAKPGAYISIIKVLHDMLPGALAHPCSHITIFIQPLDRLDQSRDIPRWDQQPGIAIEHHFAAASNVASHYRTLHRRGLHTSARNSFPVGGQHTNIHRRVPRPHVLTPVDEAHHAAALQIVHIADVEGIVLVGLPRANHHELDARAARRQKFSCRE